MSWGVLFVGITIVGIITLIIIKRMGDNEKNEVSFGEKSFKNKLLDACCIKRR